MYIYEVRGCTGEVPSKRARKDCVDMRGNGLAFSMMV